MQRNGFSHIAFLDICQAFQQGLAAKLFIVEVSVKHAEHAQAACGFGTVAGFAGELECFGMCHDGIGKFAGAAMDHADNAGLADAAMGFDAQCFEAFGDERRRAVFLESEFWVGVNVATKRGNVCVLGAQRVWKVHDASR